VRERNSGSDRPYEVAERTGGGLNAV